MHVSTIAPLDTFFGLYTSFKWIFYIRVWLVRLFLFQYLNVFLTRVDGLRRRFSTTQSEDGVKYASIRDTFQVMSLTFTIIVFLKVTWICYYFWCLMLFQMFLNWELTPIFPNMLLSFCLMVWYDVWGGRVISLCVTILIHLLTRKMYKYLNSSKSNIFAFSCAL